MPHHLNIVCKYYLSIVNYRINSIPTSVVALLLHNLLWALSDINAHVYALTHQYYITAEHLFVRFVLFFYLGFNIVSTLYRSYPDGYFYGQRNQYIQLFKVLYCNVGVPPHD